MKSPPHREPTHTALCLIAIVALCGPAFEKVSLAEDRTRPAPPVGLTVTVGNHLVALNWDDNTESDLASYKVYRDTAASGTYTQIAAGLITSHYIDASALNGVTYQYVVSAVDTSNNESHQSEPISASPQIPIREMEYLDRGVVAVQVNDTQTYIGWRMLGAESAATGYNVYRNATKLNDEPITGSTNYLDSVNSTRSRYRVAAVVDGVEQELSEPATPWDHYYHDIPLQRPAAGVTPSLESYDYSPNDASVGDLDGDGQYEIVLKWQPSNAHDAGIVGYTGNQILDAYELDGTFLWRIDLGINIRAGSHYTAFLVYDFDSDGKAEVACKTADGTTDGQGMVLGDPNAVWRDSNGFVLSGPEYLSVFDGQTGAFIDTVDYIAPRGDVCDWGDCFGGRVNRLLGCVAYLDGKHPSLVMTRGLYAKIVLAAWDLVDGQLVLRWVFDSDDPGNSAYAGQGNHNLSVADVDGDGLDEIIYGSATIDHNGTGLYSTELGHGDALHVGDLDPSRPGLEVWACHESAAAGDTFRDAATGEVIWEHYNAGDVGRCMAAHIDSNFAGAQLWSYAADGTYAVDNTQISTNRASQDFAVWWTADLQRELLDAADGEGRNPKLDKWDSVSKSVYRLLSLYNIPTAYSTSSNNYSKANPCLSADILGDWREEMIFRSSDNTKLRIFTTTDLTSHRLYTLMHDPQYRLAIAWQNVGYNQPPHPSFYIGASMNTPPTPNIVLLSPCYVAPPGDQDCDGDVDADDAVALLDCLNDAPAETTSCEKLDLNEDGETDLRDYAAFQLLLMNN